MRRGWPWPLLVVGLLAASASANVYLLVRAAGDPSFSVEPDYYAKAVGWDAHLEQLRRNAALGWTARLEAGPGGVGVRLSDREGRAVGGARVEIEAFHRARGNQIVRGILQETAEHVYRAAVPLARPGVWEFRLTVTRGAETFTAVLEQTVAAGRP